MKNALINKAIGHIKIKPNYESESSDEALFGMSVEIINKVDREWYYIRTEYKYEGYINERELFIDDEKEEQYRNNKNVTAIINYGDILQKPSIESSIIGNFTKGAELLEIGKIKNNFTNILLPNGENGWVKSSYLRKLQKSYDINDEEKLRENIVEDALSYLGVQYRWGGKTPLGIDCSGLCSISYMLNGIVIYRDAKIKEGFPIKEIDFKKAKRGDLLFFKGHVAIYLGQNKYIHSSNTYDGVRINSFNKCDDDYFEYLGGKLLKVGSIF